MAIFSSNLIYLTSISAFSSSITLHTPFFISSTFSVKPISSKTLIKPLRASTQQKKYVYPDPIIEFAVSETQKFEGELLKKLSTNKEFGDDLDKVVKVCAEIKNMGVREPFTEKERHCCGLKTTLIRTGKYGLHKHLYELERRKFI